MKKKTCFKSSKYGRLLLVFLVLLVSVLVILPSGCLDTEADNQKDDGTETTGTFETISTDEDTSAELTDENTLTEPTDGDTSAEPTDEDTLTEEPALPTIIASHTSGGSSRSSSSSSTAPAAPIFVSAETNEAGTIVTITFNKAMHNPDGKQSQFSFNDGTDKTFCVAVLNADTTKIDLTVNEEAVVNGANVTVDYTAGDVVAADNGVLANFTPQTVTNNVPVPAPTFVSAETNEAGTIVTITFNKAMANPDGKQSQFSFNDGTDKTFSVAALNADTTKIDLTVNGTAIANGANVTVDYTAGDVAAADNGVLANFTPQTITNNVPGAAPIFVSAETNEIGNIVTITFNKAMANPDGKQSQFSFNDGTNKTFCVAALNATTTKIDLTVNEAAIANGVNVTVDYTAGDVVAADNGVLATFTSQTVTNI
jgi:hypothetical protein